MADPNDADLHTRYTRTAMALHWAIAVLIVWQIGSGLWMVPAVEDTARWERAFQVYQWHKSSGWLVLVLSLLRLAWRLTHPPPPLPVSVSRMPRGASRCVHALLYVLMIVVPLAGWAVVSASPLGLQTEVFGLFRWPHLPLSPATEPVAKATHRWLALLLGALAIGHVSAALWHHAVLRDRLVLRMWPKR